MRAIFFDEDQAREVLARLLRDGFAASLDRERLAGEDDDEDHPWAVVSDAPEFLLELLVDDYDGWLDVEEADGSGGPGGALGSPPPLPPLNLPSQPRRVKRPDLLGDQPLND